jgi:hypothetical protein
MMAEKKKPKPGPSTGGKVTSRMKDTGKKVPVTSVTPRATVSKPSKAQISGTRKVVGALTSATVAGRAALATQKAADLARIKNLENKINAVRNSNNSRNMNEGQKRAYLSLMEKYTDLQMKTTKKK